MTTIAEENTNSKALVVESPGAQLAQVRENSGYTLEYVADKLRLKVSVLQELERDDYSKMPGTVFIKGYMRAYAKLLCIAADDIITAFDARHVEAAATGVTRMLCQTKKYRKREEQFIRFVSGLVLLLLVFAVTAWWQYSQEKVVTTTPTIQKMPIQTTSQASAATPDEANAKVSVIQSLFVEPKDEPKQLERLGD